MRDAERVGLIEGRGAPRRLAGNLDGGLGQRDRLAVKIVHIVVKRRVVDEFACNGWNKRERWWMSLPVTEGIKEKGGR